MDHTKQQILEKYKSSLVRDLEVEFILDKLLEHSVLTHNEKQKIDREVSFKMFPYIYDFLRLYFCKYLLFSQRYQEEKAKVFLEILLTKNNCAFDVFLKLLQDDYEWLFEALSQVYIVDDGEDERRFQNAIVLGDLPRLPTNYIERTNIVCIIFCNHKSAFVTFYKLN